MTGYTRPDLDTIHNTIDTLALLPLPQAASCAAALDQLLYSSDPRHAEAALQSVQQVRDILMRDTDPQRWHTEVELLNVPMDMVQAVIEERLAQVRLLNRVADVLATRCGVTL